MTLIGASRRSNNWRGTVVPGAALPGCRCHPDRRRRGPGRRRTLVPAPVSTMQRVSGSLLASTSLAESSLSIEPLIAFSRSGRLRVNTATRPVCSTSSSSVPRWSDRHGCSQVRLRFRNAQSTGREQSRTAPARSVRPCAGSQLGSGARHPAGPGRRRRRTAIVRRRSAMPSHPGRDGPPPPLQ